MGQPERFVDDLESGFSGHAQIGQNDVKRSRVEEIKGLVCTGCRRDIVMLREGLLESLTSMFLVINDQNGRHHRSIHAAHAAAVKPVEITAEKGPRLFCRCRDSLHEGGEATKANRRMRRRIKERHKLVAPERK